MAEQLGRVMVGAAVSSWDLKAGSSGKADRETAALLAQVPLFATLSKRHLGRVAGVATTKRYAAHTPLVREGNPADAFFVILDGEARVDVPGRAVPLSSGDFFGEMGLIDGEPRSATVSAVTDVLVLMIPRAKFLKLLESEPKVALGLLAALTRRLRAVQAAVSL
jgi:CRP/FNR family cyclic AMP-dependent transcriptional regulator